jgi:signal transduction histidine kinase
MQNRWRADAIDTRIVFKAYAVLACLTGIVLAGWGQRWFGSDFPGLPMGKAVLIRVLGAMLIAAGCFAAPFAFVDDPQARRRGLLWFAAGHAVVWGMLFLQLAIWGQVVANWIVNLPFAIGFALFYLAVTDRGHGNEPQQLTSLFTGDGSSTKWLHSEYEQHIREAASQEERNRLARDLHDSIKQQVFVIQTAAATAQTRFNEDPPGARLALEQVRSSAREAMTEMQAMLDQLRAAPLENNSLIEALKQQCEALGFRTGAQVEFKLGTLPPSEAFEPGAQQAILRVAQEALANIGRHARAKNVTVELDSWGGRVQLRIEDDGSGFDTNRPATGMGLANMRARASEFNGEFWLASLPGGGTTVRLSIPHASVPPLYDYRKQAVWGTVGLIVFAILVPLWGRSWGPSPMLWLPILAITVARMWVAYFHSRKQARAAR